MGFVHADITLKNVKDIMKAEEGLIKEAEIRQASVHAMVDTGARTLVISEAIRQQLGLELKEERRATLGVCRTLTDRLLGEDWSCYTHIAPALP